MAQIGFAAPSPTPKFTQSMQQKSVISLRFSRQKGENTMEKKEIMQQQTVADDAATSTDTVKTKVTMDDGQPVSEDALAEGGHCIFV